jgi:hypothetical protein
MHFFLQEKSGDGNHKSKREEEEKTPQAAKNQYIIVISSYEVRYSYKKRQWKPPVKKEKGRKIPTCLSPRNMKACHNISIAFLFSFEAISPSQVISLFSVLDPPRLVLDPRQFFLPCGPHTYYTKFSKNSTRV